MGDAVDMSPMNLMRSFLFVPGNRPERFAKAAASGADVYCIDLEDAVPSSDKANARCAALDYLAARGGHARDKPYCYLRVNPLTTAAGLEDMLALRAAVASGSVLPDVLVLPMVASVFEVQQIVQLLDAHSELKIMPIVETPEGVNALAQILALSNNVVAVGFGGADYTACTGSDGGWDALLQARSSIASHANVRGIHCFDSPWFVLDDESGLIEETARVSRLGFGGKMAVHPSQVAVINRMIGPSDKELCWAQDIITAYEKAGGGALSVGGMMVDEPVVQRARRMLAFKQ